MSSLSLEDMITSLLVEERRMNEDDTYEGSQNEIALFSKGRMKNTKGSIECFYYHKFGHTSWNCRVRANDSLNGTLIESTNIVGFEDDP
jgi:hypothetical protein